jgi:hypothetical protein
MREVWCGAYKENCVAINETGDAWNMYLVCRSRASDKVNLNAEIESCFAESSVCSLWEDPEETWSVTDRQ